MSAAFPGTGRRVIATFPAFRFRLHFVSTGLLHWTRLHDDGSDAASETVAIASEPIADAVFLVSWQECNRTTVVQVADFARRIVRTHITRADGSFVRARGSLVPLGDGAAAIP